MQYDVFICHASEDKEDFVRPLAERLKQLHLEVWYDEFSLKIGDSLMEKIDEGLAFSRFGIVVLSPNFFNKPWAKRELKGLTSREMSEGKNLILPIWHRVGLEEVLKFSPPLADKKAGSSTDGINSLTRELKNKIKPDESPLIVAQEFLKDYNVATPPISDEWWLDIVEYKEFLHYPDLNMGKRWIFPLPFEQEATSNKRGTNIGSTALQLDWSFEGEELNISPTTNPEKVHEYIHRWPGLYDCAKANPHILALYVPQLTIPGFDSGFEKEFDELLLPDNTKASMFISYGLQSTIDGNPPLCGDVIAYRHPTFGNFSSRTLGRWYFGAYDSSYTRSHWEEFEGLVWLLSSDSKWLSNEFNEMLIDGICNGGSWMTRDYDNLNNPFIANIMNRKQNFFKYTKTVQEGLEEMVLHAINQLGIKESSKQIVQKLMDINLADRYYNFIDRRNERIKK